MLCLWSVSTRSWLQVKEIALDWVGLIQSVESLKSKKVGFPGEKGILPWDCNTRLSFQPAVQISDLTAAANRLSQFLKNFSPFPPHPSFPLFLFLWRTLTVFWCKQKHCYRPCLYHIIYNVNVHCVLLWPLNALLMDTELVFCFVLLAAQKQA